MPTSPQDDLDRRFMALALRLAERGLGRSWPNPAVGCVVVKAARILGRGWTQPPPGPHAEVEALRRAGPEALGATAYISLEPCAHYGRTPPCTMALLHAGIRRVVAATGDPDPRVDGKGLAQLRQAGVEVQVGVLDDEAACLNAGFFLRVRQGRPLVTLKLATSLDGRIATRTGASQWITGEAARAHGHGLRASHDAIMIGSGTALADDPSLTCRLPGMHACSPVRVVFDRRLRLPAGSVLARSARQVRTWVIASAETPPAQVEALHALGVEILAVPNADDDAASLRAGLRALAERGVTRVLVEGGATLAAALLRARLVDRLVWYQAPLVIGGDGRPAVDSLAIDSLAQAVALEGRADVALEPDHVRTYIVNNG